jgi:nicotinate-nucleotide adenylyltransferase
MDIVFGGTFNPPHCGHERVIERLRVFLPQARIHLMPCWQPVHKAPAQVPVAIRRQWLEAFISPWPEVALDEREWHRSAPSYTLDSLRAWRRACGPEQPLAFAIGSDSFAQFEHWHEWRTLLDLAHWLIVSRPDYPASPSAAVAAECRERWLADDQVAQLWARPAGLVMTVPGEPLAAASSQVRLGQQTTHLLPERVRVLWADYMNHPTGFHS